jgi:uncharacterized protein (TIGR03437 family)
VANGGQGALNWTAAATILTGATSDGIKWLALNPTGGAAVSSTTSNSSFVDVTADGTKLSPGEYYATLQVSAPDAANNPQIATVILDVLQFGSDPGPDVEPGGLIFTGVAGVSPGSQTITIQNSSANSVGFAVGNVVLNSQNWLVQAPVTGLAVPGQPTQVVVQPDYTNLSPGTYNGVLTFVFAQGAVRTVNVVAIVAPSNPSPSLRSATSMEPLSRIQPQAGTCKPTGYTVQLQSPGSGFTVTVGAPSTVTVQAVDNCQNPLVPGTNSAVNVTFSNGDYGAAGLKLNYVAGSNGVWTNTWRPVTAASSVQVAVTAFTNLGAFQIPPITGKAQTGAPYPLVTSNGIVHAASFVTGLPLAPGSLVTIKGANLADTDGNADGVPLPIVLNGSTAALGSSNLNIMYASSPQLNVQIPFDVPVDTGYQIYVERDNIPSVPENLLIAEAQPGIFTTNQAGSGQGLIFKSDGVTLAQSGSPASVGEAVTILCAGLGAVSPSIATGSLPSSDPTIPVPTPTHAVTVSIAGAAATVISAGLSRSYVGVYEVNATVPAGIVTGDSVPVAVTVAGQTSPAVTMSIQAAQ